MISKLIYFIGAILFAILSIGMEEPILTNGNFSIKAFLLLILIEVFWLFVWWLADSYYYSKLSKKFAKKRQG